MISVETDSTIPSSIRNERILCARSVSKATPIGSRKWCSRVLMGLVSVSILSYGRDARKNHPVRILIIEHRDEIRLVEVLVLEQDGLVHDLGQGVCEAVPKIQLRRMPAAFAKISVGFAGNSCLLGGDCFNRDGGFGNKVVKPSTRDRIPAPIDDGCSLEIIRGRNAADFRTLDR